MSFDSFVSLVGQILFWVAIVCLSFGALRVFGILYRAAFRQVDDVSPIGLTEEADIEVRTDRPFGRVALFSVMTMRAAFRKAGALADAFGARVKKVMDRPAKEQAESKVIRFKMFN